MTLEPDGVATQVARLHYDRGLSKVEIGERLGMSRFRVARLLQRARDAGLVRIEYRDLPSRDLELARRLETAHELDLCVVADDETDALGATARAAAEVLAELLAPDETLGIAWGSTLAAMVERLPAASLAGLTVVPLAGGSTRVERHGVAGEIARRAAERLGGRHLELYAPAFVGTAELRRGLADEPEVAAVLAAWERMGTAVVGIGAWPADGSLAGSSLLTSGALSDAEVAELRSRGAVGELVVHPFDADGRLVAPDLAERAVAIAPERLHDVPRVVAVAAGDAKAEAIRGALATGMVDVLVTDAAAAAAIAGSAEVTA